jgi:hypothetical protein
MEFFIGSTNLSHPNNRITTEISRDRNTAQLEGSDEVSQARLDRESLRHSSQLRSRSPLDADAVSLSECLDEPLHNRDETRQPFPASTGPAPHHRRPRIARGVSRAMNGIAR